ncbi:flagellar protein FlaG [Nevskia sp.]|uniref:flagellar protein FlaG n=1 Tax=Nevskia sp. TaxID=1929292 RepID=UPI0025F34DCC|nr:flagellar protein FlaG [Nevskia sp.]
MSLNTTSAVTAIPANAVVDRFAVPVYTPVGGAVAQAATPQIDQPPATAATDAAAPPVQLANAVDSLNQKFKDSRTDLRFTVDQDSGRTIVSVVTEDGTVIRQIPGDEVLRIAKALDKALGTLIERTA